MKPTWVTVNESAMRYMQTHMGLTRQAIVWEQGPNQRLRHLIQFALRMIKADRARQRKPSKRGTKGKPGTTVPPRRRAR